MNIGIHAAHCCKFHGCKYADDVCPVVSEGVKQLYPCEECCNYRSVKAGKIFISVPDDQAVAMEKYLSTPQGQENIKRLNEEFFASIEKETGEVSMGCKTLGQPKE